MPLTLILVNPAPVTLPKEPTGIPNHAIAALAKALNTVTYGGPDETVDGTAIPCEDFWLSEVSPQTLQSAIEHLAGRNMTLAWSLSVTFLPLIAYATAERRTLDIVREGPNGPELRISPCEEPLDPRQWPYRRMSSALSLMGLSITRNAAPAIIEAAQRVANACIESLPARDAERLGQFARTMTKWDDDPVLICRPAIIPDSDVLPIKRPAATPDP